MRVPEIPPGRAGLDELAIGHEAQLDHVFEGIRCFPEVRADRYAGGAGGKYESGGEGHCQCAGFSHPGSIGRRAIGVT